MHAQCFGFAYVTFDLCYSLQFMTRFSRMRRCRLTPSTDPACRHTQSAAREIKFFFPRVSVDPVPDKLEAKAYLERQLGPALTRGLVELSKGRPTTDEVAALQWLSAWLLDNNPNKPRVRMVEEFPLPEDLVDDESGFVRHQAVDIELMEQSAVKIQAHIRGTLARRRLANKRAALEKDKKEVEEVGQR